LLIQIDRPHFVGSTITARDDHNINSLWNPAVHPIIASIPQPHYGCSHEDTIASAKHEVGSKPERLHILMRLFARFN
jgi:hypothetical protein